MKWTFGMILLLIGLLLGGCGEEKKKEKNEDVQTTEETKPEADSSSEMKQRPAKQPIKEAANLPPKEKEALLSTLDRHVEAFNSKNLDAYMSTISKKTDRDYEEERLYMKKVFNTLEAKMEPQHTVIIQYDEKKKEAYIFVVMKSVTKTTESAKAVEQTTRQVMKFNKEEDGWKQTGLSAME